MPGCSGGRDFVCSDHCLSASAHLRLRACSRSSRFCFHILCGAYFPGLIGMRSRTGLPNTHIAGDSLVAGSGVLQCWRTARWNASVFRLPLADMLPARSLLIDLTPTSARQLLCGKATELRLWCMPQSLRNWTVMAAVNSRPPSVASSSGMP